LRPWGSSNKEIATKLYLSVNTVRNHVQRVLNKIDLIEGIRRRSVNCVGIGLRPERNDRTALLGRRVSDEGIVLHCRQHTRSIDIELPTVNDVNDVNDVHG
jgi:hypothetical protein